MNFENTNYYYVFVYGSLKNDFHNSGVLKYSEFVCSSRLKDHALYVFGTKTGSGNFPVMIPNKHHSVMGEVYIVDDYTLKILDDLESEGDMYNRVLVDILVDGSIQEVYTYVGNHSFWKGYLENYSTERLHNWKKP